MYTTTAHLSADRDAAAAPTFGNIRGFLTRVTVEMINLSDVDQTVKVKILDFANYQVVSFADLASGLAALPTWTQNATYPFIRSRTSDLTDAFFDIPAVNVPAKKRAVAFWSINCKALDTTMMGSCTLDESSWAGYVIPYSTGIYARSDISMRFQLDTTQDRGALLGSFSVEHYIVGSAANSLSQWTTREINGGKAF